MKTKSLALAPDPAVVALKVRATKLLKSWQDVEVTDTKSFESAGEAVKQAVSIRKDLKALPVCVELARQKAEIKEKEKLLKDVDNTIKRVEEVIRLALVHYASRQREAQERQITSALSKGKDEKAAALAAKPFIPEVSGLSFTEHWHAEVENLHDFVAWCLSGPMANLETFLMPNLVALNARARDLKAEDLGIPGVKGVKETSSSVRT